MHFVTYFLVFWSAITAVVRCQGGLPTINTPLSCRAPLPIEWFINNTQSTSNLPSSITGSLAAASKNLSSYIESIFSTGDTISVIVGTPWDRFRSSISETFEVTPPLTIKQSTLKVCTELLALPRFLHFAPFHLSSRSSRFWSYSFYNRRGNCLFSILLKSISHNSTYRPMLPWNCWQVKCLGLGTISHLIR